MSHKTVERNTDFKCSLLWRLFFLFLFHFIIFYSIFLLCDFTRNCWKLWKQQSRTIFCLSLLVSSTSCFCFQYTYILRCLLQIIIFCFYILGSLLQRFLRNGSRFVLTWFSLFSLFCILLLRHIVVFSSRSFQVIRVHFVKVFIGFFSIEIFSTTFELIVLCFILLYIGL